MSLVLAPIGDEPVPPALPGQYVSVQVRMPDGVRQLRQYTLSGHGTDGLRRITVKRVHGEGAPEGEVSNLLHADRSEPAHALRHDMESLTAALPNGEKIFWYEDGERGRVGRFDLAEVEIPTGAVAYLCGPLPFMRETRAQLIEGGVAPRDIHYEVFGPDLWLAAS